MTAPKGATDILTQRMKLDFVVEKLSERAKTHDWLATADAEVFRQVVRERAVDLLDEWSKIAQEYHNQGIYLQYQQYEAGAARPLLYDFLDPELKKMPQRHQKFKANRSMRDVEPSVNVWLRNLDDVEIEEEDES